MKKGSEFEKVAKKIYEELSPNSIVTLNDKIMGKDSGTEREIDVSIRTTISACELLIIVQCKDHNKVLNVTYVDELWGVMQDVMAQKGILIAKKGFSKSAIQSAAKKGIELCLIHDAESKNWLLDIDIPIIIEVIMPLLDLETEVHLNKGDPVDLEPKNWSIGGINIITEFTKEWNDGKLAIDGTGNLFKLAIPDPYILLANGEKRSVTKYSLHYSIRKSYKFGYVKELPHAKAIKQILNGRYNILLKEKDFYYAMHNFKDIYDPEKYNNIDKISLLATPEIDPLKYSNLMKSEVHLLEKD